MYTVLELHTRCLKRCQFLPKRVEKSTYYTKYVYCHEFHTRCLKRCQFLPKRIEYVRILETDQSVYYTCRFHSSANSVHPLFENKGLTLLLRFTFVNIYCTHPEWVIVVLCVIEVLLTKYKIIYLNL